MKKWLRALALLTILASLPLARATAEDITPQQTRNRIALPLIMGGAGLPPGPFGFDLRAYTTSDIMNLAAAARPRWSRAGDLLWNLVEPVRGGGYRWEQMAALETNIRRLRAAGIEPTIIVQGSPTWARTIPNLPCSQPRAEHHAAFLAFVRAAAQRYSSAELRVDYWEFWNEPDYHPDDVPVDGGFGCWATREPPYYGGEAYGQLVPGFTAAVKGANPSAIIFAGALAHHWPDDRASLGFLRGMLRASGNTFDVLSFHAYGDWSAGDRLIYKHTRLRAVLREFGIEQKPMIATEIAATCESRDAARCPPNFAQQQANYAARIYAQALALNLLGAFWYTLASPNPGFDFSHLVVVKNDGQFETRPAYYAFRNSALLLQGTQYVGPPIIEPRPDQIDDVQVLKFRKPGVTIYVFWVMRADVPGLYNLAVPPGARAICVTRLEEPQTAASYCSDDDRNGVIPRAVNELPQYVLVYD